MICILKLNNFLLSYSYCVGSETNVDTNVDVTECCFKHCMGAGMAVGDGVTVTAARCGFMKNESEVGVFCGGANTKSKIARLQGAPQWIGWFGCIYMYYTM